MKSPDLSGLFYLCLFVYFFSIFAGYQIPMGLNFIKRIRQVRDQVNILIDQKNTEKGLSIAQF